MPGGDGTGPMGMGPMTGRGAGYCAGYATPGHANPVPGRGRGMGGGRGFFGRGGGRGRRNMFFATGLTGWQRGWTPFAGLAAPSTLSKEEELDLLKNQAGQLESTLSNIRQRLQELEAEQK